MSTHSHEQAEARAVLALGAQGLGQPASSTSRETHPTQPGKVPSPVTHGETEAYRQASCFLIPQLATVNERVVPFGISIRYSTEKTHSSSHNLQSGQWSLPQ